MKDLIIIGGAPGSGKTTVSKILAEKLDSFVFDYGILREVHLDPEWSNQSRAEEQMSFENLIYILQNYKRNGYKNVILNDLRDFRIQEIPEVLPEFDYAIFTLYVDDDSELKNRVEGERDSGFKNSDEAIEWNRGVIERETVKNETKINNSHTQPQKTANEILKLINV